jgi:transmembrane sensor
MKRIPIDVIDRYMVGSSSQEECVEVERWLAEPDHQVLLQALRENEGGGQALSDIRGEDITWERVWFRALSGGRPATHASKGRRGINPHPPRSRTGWHIISGLALSAILLSTGWAIGHHRAPYRTHRLPLIYSTGPGERANITLSDGSTVVLDVASRLEVPADNITDHHTMRLMGEALFTVSHRDGVPFTVVAGGVATRVLGTSFLVRHYASDTTTTVAVREGRVAVGSAVLAAHQLVELTKGGAWQIVPADAAEFTFATGTLTLPEMPLAQAIPELNRWYDADIRLGDSALAARHIVGEFAAGSLADVRAILAMTFGVRVVRAGKTLTLYPR